MAVDIQLIRAYRNGLVAVTERGATGVTLPTDASTELGADFHHVGAITTEGISESTNQDRQDIFIWQNNTLARTLPGNYTKQFSFAAAETNLITVGIQFPGSTITQTEEGLTVAEVAPDTDIRSWVLHGIDGTRALRIVIPLGEVVERGDVAWSAGNITVYQWTLRAYVDSSGIVAYRYYLDEALADAG